jgi:hypothetical protein
MKALYNIDMRKELSTLLVLVTTIITIFVLLILFFLGVVQLNI